MSQTKSAAAGKPLQLIFILPDLEAGGAERIVTTLANNLPREYFQPNIMLMRKEGPYLAFLRDDVEVIDLKVQRIRSSLFPILREIRKRQPDIVFSGFGEVNAYLSPFIRFFPQTKFIARETNVVSEHVTRRSIRFFYKFYPSYHRIICQSDDMKNDLVRNFKLKEKKLVKINNPVDFGFIEEQLKGQERPVLYNGGQKNILAVGNLSARKGFDNLLRVFSHLMDENIHLHILGNGADKEKLLKLQKELGLQKVFFHGQQSNPYPYLKFADAFVLSSRYEGFPNVLLEAGACGTIAVANNCPGGISEIIEEGINGYTGNIDDHTAFAELITKVLDEPGNSDRIKESIHRRFSLPVILTQYEKALRSL